MRETFETLIKRISPTLRRISHRLNGRFAFFNDEDLCQEALVHLWQLFQDGRLSDKTDSYILQGCYYHLKNYIRISADKVNITSIENPIDEDGTILGDIIASKDSVSLAQIEERALCEEIRKNKLSEREIEVLNMCFDGLTTREIGKRLGVSHVAVVKLRKKIRIKCAELEKDMKGRRGPSPAKGGIRINFVSQNWLPKSSILYLYKQK